MKTTKTIFLILLLTFISLTSFSQQLKVTVNQLEMGLEYTAAQIINNLGAPDEIINEPVDVFENFVTYKYGNNIFSTVENELCFFTLKDTTFSVNGILRVGQNKSTVSQLGGIIVENSIDSLNNYGIIKWIPFEQYLNGNGYMTVFYNLNNNLIYRIVFKTILL
ncbi:MAG: hypothetical protein ABFC18_04535 [Rikenellaceae bacterium]|jgi:hypothetical protein